MAAQQPSSLPPTSFPNSDLALAWLAAIIDSADDAIISKTLEGIITSWNAGAERMFGYAEHEVIGKPVTVLIPEDHLDEEPEILRRIRNGERVEHYETVRKHKDGQRIDISLTVSPIKAIDGTIIGASKIARDISDRKRSEIALSEQNEIIETVNRLGHALAAELDLTKLAQAIADAATEVSGARFGAFFYTVQSGPVGSHVNYAVSGFPRETFAQFQLSRIACIFRPSFKTEGRVLIDNVNDDPRYGKPSALYSWIADDLMVASYLSVPVVSRSGEICGGLFFGHSAPGVFSERDAQVVEGIAAQAAIAIDNARLYDVARKAAEENERLYRQAEESSHLKEEFLATVSHELRNPLSAILGWSRLLRTGKLPPSEIEKALETIERNARTQTQLIDDLLDVSRIITGKLRMDVHPVVPNVFIEAAIEAVKPAAAAKGVFLENVIDTGSAAVPGDPVRLQQVVWNLLSNAIKFTPRGGWVRIILERIDSHLEIIVSDSGQGISAEFLPYVFDRFRQADQRNSRRHGGMGIGLAIVKHLVEMHGGSVKAFSEGEGQGATFKVRLPIVPIYQTAPEPNYPDPRNLLLPAEFGERLDGVVILVVDDELDTRELLKVGLENCGAEVILAASADNALQTIVNHVPDLLISDIGMPDEDGYELIRRVRMLPQESGGAVPAIALTAYARVEDRLRALRSGYQMHVPKPVELAELVAVADSLVKRR